jgi:uncharacterized protein
MQTTFTNSQASLLPRRLAEVLLLMLGVQAVRAAMILLFWLVLRPAPTSPAWLWIDLAAYLLTGVGLLIVSRPAPAALGLEWSGQSRRMRWAVTGGLALLGLLLLTTLFIDPAVFLDNLKNVLVIPIFEELLFRGWIWGRLAPSLPQHRRSLLAWLLTSALFALWHLGYMDIYLLKALPANPGLELGPFLVMKLITVLIIGLVVGLPRWPTQRTYGSIILHGLVNLFGK